jgi:hypothetical protein
LSAGAPWPDVQSSRLLQQNHRIPPPGNLRLVFQPSPAAHALMKDATVNTDFRANVAHSPSGQVMYDRYAFDEGADFADLRKGKQVGQLVTTAGIVASSYGDEKLNFQHHMKQ